MRTRDYLLLALRYALFNRARTLTLVLAVTVVAALPLVVASGVRAFERALGARAETTPLVVGAPGGRFDLVLAALHYRQGADAIPTIPVSIGKSIATYIRANATETPGRETKVFPLATSHTAGGVPIVGTTLEYLDYRGLRPVAGRLPAILGEVALGAEAASQLGLKPGDTILTDRTTLFDISKNLPMRLHVTGVFGKTGTPDDRAVFCDLKTDWIIAGLGHGHDDVAKVDAKNILKKESDGADTNLVATAAVRSFVEVTPANVGSFHFHGDDLPVSAIVVIPASDKTATMLSGWGAKALKVQFLESRSVVDELLSIVIRVERFFNLGLAVVAGACLLVLGLVFALSLRLREAESDTLFRIGASRHTVVSLLAVELALIVAAGLLAALVLSVLSAELAPWVIGKIL
jgi:putative ABC transport system permease protein